MANPWCAFFSFHTPHSRLDFLYFQPEIFQWRSEHNSLCLPWLPFSIFQVGLTNHPEAPSVLSCLYSEAFHPALCWPHPTLPSMSCGPSSAEANSHSPSFLSPHRPLPEPAVCVAAPRTQSTLVQLKVFSLTNVNCPFMLDEYGTINTLSSFKPYFSYLQIRLRLPYCFSLWLLLPLHSHSSLSLYLFSAGTPAMAWGPKSWVPN